MVGTILPHTPIAADFWRRVDGVKLFFLSHLHADHIEGLRPTWNLGKIYCSPVTRTLLLHRFPTFSPAMVVGLDLDVPHRVPLDTDGDEWLTVTLIDANHCPGAVMFLFEGYFGTVLYTGDFRTSPAILQHPQLCGGAAIDHVYLDNTYLHPRHVLPAKEDALEMIVGIIRRHSDHFVLLGMDTLGKEELLCAISDALGDTKIVVSPERYAELRLLGLEGRFSTNPRDGHYIHVVPKREVTEYRLRQYSIENNCYVIGIIPTAYHHLRNHHKASNTWRTVGPDDHVPFVVPYSIHSSYDELVAFVRAVNPARMTPLLDAPDLDPRVHFRDIAEAHMEHGPRPVRVPPSVQRFMLGDEPAPRGAMAGHLRKAATMPLQRTASLCSRRSSGDGPGTAFTIAKRASVGATPAAQELAQAGQPCHLPANDQQPEPRTLGPGDAELQPGSWLSRPKRALSSGAGFNAKAAPATSFKVVIDKVVQKRRSAASAAASTWQDSLRAALVMPRPSDCESPSKRARTAADHPDHDAPRCMPDDGEMRENTHPSDAHQAGEPGEPASSAIAHAMGTKPAQEIVESRESYYTTPNGGQRGPSSRRKQRLIRETIRAMFAAGVISRTDSR